MPRMPGAGGDGSVLMLSPPILHSQFPLVSGSESLRTKLFFARDLNQIQISWAEVLFLYSILNEMIYIN